MNNRTDHGFLVLADVSGFTAFVTTTELEHGSEIIAALLDEVIEHLSPPLEIQEIEGDAVFALHPGEPKKAIYTQWGSGGAYATGEMTIEGDTLTFQSRDPDGEPWTIRHVWRRNGPDGFRVTRERKEESKWVEVLTQEYRRIPGR